MKMADKWYNSNVGEGIGLGLIIVGIGIASFMGFRGCRYEAVEEYKADKQVEIQRLSTIEKITDTYGNKMDPNDLSKFLKEHNLDKWEDGWRNKTNRWAIKIIRQV